MLLIAAGLGMTRAAFTGQDSIAEWAAATLAVAGLFTLCGAAAILIARLVYGWHESSIGVFILGGIGGVLLIGWLAFVLYGTGFLVGKSTPLPGLRCRVS